MPMPSYASPIWIIFNTSQRNFQRRYKLVVPLRDENYDMQIFKNSYGRWNCSPNNVFAEMKYQYHQIG